MQVLGSGGYGSVVALDARRVVKLQGGNVAEDGSGISGAALREVVALRARGDPGRVLMHPSGVVGIEIRRYRLSLLDWMRRERGAGRKRSRRRQARLLAILADVAQELALAHARGYVHRDVKPENVMLDDRGRAHLIDWGMSRHTAGGSGRWTPGVTTLWYRAPELFTGEAYGAAVDMWSLGVMIVELVAGRCPFRGRTEVEQAAHYVDVLGPPPQGALRRWPFATSPLAEPRRADSVWATVPHISETPGLQQIVDGLVRWTAAERTPADQLLLHPLLAPRRRPASAPIAPRSPPPPPPPSSCAKPLRRAVRTVILPACRRLGLPPLPVAWCAAKFMWRAIAGGAGGTCSWTSLLCLDLAVKLVGTRRPRGLTLPGGARVAAAQVRLVQRAGGDRGAIGAAGLADGVEQACGALAEIVPRVPDECPAPFAPAALAWSRFVLEAALEWRPERVLAAHSWDAIGPPLRALGVFVATGITAQLARTRRLSTQAGRRVAPRLMRSLAVSGLLALPGMPPAPPQTLARLKAALAALAI